MTRRPARRGARTTLRGVAIVVIALLAVAGLARPWRRGRSTNAPTRHHRDRAAREFTPIVPPLPLPEGAFRVTFLDVGQGDGALLESRDGHAAMIDVGPPEAEDHVANVLRAHGVTRLDWIVLTHPHLDHVGGAARLADIVAIGREYDGEYPHTIHAMTAFLARLGDQGVAHVRAERAQSLVLGTDVHVALLAPQLPFLEHTRSGPNANSVIARVEGGGHSILFEGDAEQETEERLLEESTRGDLRSDILKVAHHGSRYASTPAFLDRVHPRWAVISCGTANDYGHPHLETLQSLARREVTVWRTDLDGDVTATIGDEIRWTTTRPGQDLDRWAPGTHTPPRPN